MLKSMRNIITPEKLAESKKEIPDGAIEVARDLIKGKYPNEEAFLDDYKKESDAVIEKIGEAVAPGLTDQDKIELNGRIKDLMDGKPPVELQEAA